MPQFRSYHSSTEVPEKMEDMQGRFPKIFQGFDVNKLYVVHTDGKKCKGCPIMVKAVKYPHDVWLTKPYIVEVFESKWSTMSDEMKAIAVFHSMLAIPTGGFDPTSKRYATLRSPDDEVYQNEFTVAGSVANRKDNKKRLRTDERAMLNIGRHGEDDAYTDSVHRTPVTTEAIIRKGQKSK